MRRCRNTHTQYINRLQKKLASQELEKKSDEEVILDMKNEMCKQTPSLIVLKALLSQCRKKRQEDARKAKSAVEHLKKYPALKIKSLVSYNYTSICVAFYRLI